MYDHCVKVIGWGRQRRLNAIGVQPYLIAVNSWSSLWAKDGEFIEGMEGANKICIFLKGTFKVDIERLAHFHSDLFAGIPQI